MRTIPHLQEELWPSVLDQSCDFRQDIFTTVMMNLIKNPNINSNRLFRADILYDSIGELDVTAFQGFSTTDGSTTCPRPIEISGFSSIRTIVRLLIPRNPQLDRSLMQTCHILQAASEKVEKALVIYIPHVDKPEEIPFYHPAVPGIAFLHDWDAAGEGAGKISIHYKYFPAFSPISSGAELDPGLQRVAFHLLSTINKHGKGIKAGYVKRVHHDQTIPQKRLQDTYSRLKTLYAKRLIENWVEQTDPTKHVFEDLGIAAFLIELWRDMYSLGNTGLSEPENNESGSLVGSNSDRPNRKFPGFVDIGCGNGILVDILLKEGYPGWGFDARRRKSWDTFPEDTQAQLREMVLIPRLLANGSENTGDGSESPKLLDDGTGIHDGNFPEGTFIISNHADELTGWTPLIASISSSPFLIIPCCSHDLSGARFRATAKSNEKGKQPSAYAALVGWVERLVHETGWVVEKDVLRIPSTRNVAVIGRRRLRAAIPLQEILGREGGGAGWRERAMLLTKGKPKEH